MSVCVCVCICMCVCVCVWGHGDVAQLVRAWDCHATDAGLIPRCSKGFFSQCRLSMQTLTCVYIPLCAIACINTCAHIKDPEVPVRVRWIMETLKHLACTVGWVAWLWLLAFPRESNLNFPWEKSHWDNTVQKKKSSGFGNSMVKDLVVTLLFLGGVSLGSCQCADPWQPVQPFQPAA